ncbi:MAG: hypothetical protein F4039_08420 [Gammaproteobacteria bacterium]|nr:hypothetical protein [Gammaproteobacteria bacterium]MYK44096.1 hypothetical protein [Gammaproteobacteria bacterium]
MNLRTIIKVKRLMFATSAFLVVWLLADETLSIEVNLSEYFEEKPVWIGKVGKEGKRLIVNWSVHDSPELTFEIPITQSLSKLVFLRKDATPKIYELTADLVNQGLSINFSKGATVLGKVFSSKDKNVVTEGVIYVQFDTELEVPTPDSEHILSWEIEADGTFMIQGLPKGKHTISVVAPNYLLAEKVVVVHETEELYEVNFSLEKAVFISGRIVGSPNSFAEVTQFKGYIDIESSIHKRQTEPIRTVFSDDQEFMIGPFPVGTRVQLSARLSDGRHSKPIEVIAPTRDLELWVSRWVRVFGKVQDQLSGEPITKFRLLTNLVPVEISAPNGKFSYEIQDHSGDISIDAPGYQFWTETEVEILKEVHEYDLGVIELIPSHSVRGRVIAGDTGEPLPGAKVLRYDGGSSDAGFDARANWIRRWNQNHLTTKTDNLGEFVLEGFPKQGGQIFASASDLGYDGEVITIYDVSELIEFSLDPLGSISGRVESIHGDPVAADIRYPGGSTRTEDGYFHFYVSAGKHRYRAIAKLGQSEVLEIETEPGEVLDNLRIVIDIVGRVYGSVEGLMEDETVNIGVDGVSKFVYSDGPYEFFGVREGIHSISSKTSRGREITGTIEMGTSQEVQFDLHFSGTSSISGKVLIGENGLPETEIIARPENNNFPLGRTSSSEDGLYHLEALAPGTYTIEVPDRVFSKTVEIRGDISLDLQMGTNLIRGKVLASGSVRGAQLRLTGGPPARTLDKGLQTNVDASGEYRFEGLPSGTYQLTVSHPEFTKKSIRIVLNQEFIEYDVYLEDEPRN